MQDTFLDQLTNKSVYSIQNIVGSNTWKDRPGYVLEHQLKKLFKVKEKNREFIESILKNFAGDKSEKRKWIEVTQ